MEAGELRAFQQVEIDLQAFASSCCGMPSGNTKSAPQVAGDRSGNRDQPDTVSREVEQHRTP